IWQDVLGLDRVGVTDDFFRIGGDSILAIQLSHQMSKMLGSEVKVADIFKLAKVNLISEYIVLQKVDDEIVEKEF
uniref:phosphopantetheine-binding protein n=1 Tax=uncultured Aquimarina sp. TaxID=575652 RepID=UPI00260622FA